MARLFQAEVQIITDDSVDGLKLQRLIEKALGAMKVSDVFVREVNIAGDIEEDLEDRDSYEESSDY